MNLHPPTVVRLLPFLLALGCAGLCLAASAPDRRLFEARAALEDALAPLAEQLARKVYAAPETPEDERRDALEIALEAIAAQGEPARLLSDIAEHRFAGPPFPTDGRVTLWQARALLSLGKPADAVAALRKASAAAPPDIAARIAQQLPPTLVAAGDTNAALSAYAALDALSDDGTDRTTPRLAHARLLLELGRTEEATRRLLDMAASASVATAPAVDAARLLASRLRLEAGNESAAVELLQPLIQTPEVAPDLRSTAHLLLAQMADRRGDATAAMSASEQAVATAQSTAAQFAALANIARLHNRHGQPDLALPYLRQAARLMPRAPETGALHVEVADALYRAALYPLALQEYQTVIASFADPAVESRAQRGRGEALAATGRSDEASVALLRASDLSTVPETQAACLFRAAETLREGDLHGQAVEALARFQSRFPSSPLVTRAALLQGESLAVTAPAEAERHFLAVAERYPQTAEAAQAVFRAAQLAALRDDTPVALARYDQAATHSAGSPELHAASLLGRGLLHFKAFHFDLALGDFDRAIAAGETAAAEQAAFLRAAALYNLGLESESLESSLAFLKTHADSAWAPDVTYWLGRYSFNRQKFEDAENYFQRFADTWPTRPECDGALLWVSRARFELKRYAEASAAALRLIREHAQSPLVPEARLIHGEALCELMRFDEAILAFDELLALHPDSPWVAQALGRKGDSLFTLGNDDEARYPESIAVYNALLARPGLPLDSQMQAEYKIGRCYEKSGQAELAVDHYYRGVVLRFLEAREAGLWPNERVKAWFSRAALSAADLFEQREQWDTAISVLQRMAREDVPGRAEADERAKRLLRAHPAAAR